MGSGGTSAGITQLCHEAEHSRLTIQSVPLATEPGISLIILPLMRILQRNLTHTPDTHYTHTLQTHTTDTFLFISHTTNVLLFKFRCNIFTGIRIIKEMPGLVASGTLCINKQLDATITVY